MTTEQDFNGRIQACKRPASQASNLGSPKIRKDCDSIPSPMFHSTALQEDKGRVGITPNGYQISQPHRKLHLLNRNSTDYGLRGTSIQHFVLIFYGTALQESKGVEGTTPNGYQISQPHQKPPPFGSNTTNCGQQAPKAGRQGGTIPT